MAGSPSLIVLPKGPMGCTLVGDLHILTWWLSYCRYTRR